MAKVQYKDPVSYIPEDIIISLFSNYEPLIFNTLNTDSKDVDQVVIDKDDEISNDIYGVKNSSDIKEVKNDFIRKHIVYLNLWEYNTFSLGVVKFKFIKTMSSENTETPTGKPKEPSITIKIERNSKNYLLDAVKSNISILTAN